MIKIMFRKKVKKILKLFFNQRIEKINIQKSNLKLNIINKKKAKKSKKISKDFQIRINNEGIFMKTQRYKRLL